MTSPTSNSLMHFSMAMAPLHPTLSSDVSRERDRRKPAVSRDFGRGAGLKGRLESVTRRAAIPKFSVSRRPGKDLARYESYQMVNLLGRFDHERVDRRTGFPRFGRVPIDRYAQRTDDGLQGRSERGGGVRTPGIGTRDIRAFDGRAVAFDAGGVRSAKSRGNEGRGREGRGKAGRGERAGRPGRSHQRQDLAHPG